MFDVVSDYRYIFVSKNYVFYRIEEKYIRIIKLYHEKEDFMWQLFGVDTTPQETIDYWNEQKRKSEVYQYPDTEKRAVHSIGF